MPDNREGQTELAPSRECAILTLKRREFLGGGLSAAIAVTVVNTAEATVKNSPAANARPTVPASTALRPTLLRINGKPYELLLEPRVTLLDALREYVGLTGTKKGCDRGQCGACTVLINGRRINSCLTLAVMHEDDEIVTIEGLTSDGELHPLQQAFIECDALQCGYCTPRGKSARAWALLRNCAAARSVR
ncbi:MAG TPA: 2Fe-2S iron-sulfur cluster-binding protein [Spongiibacteraceae bacterium]|nr:2Fe-2S iron-sulfur cluster-binding protein [Spongiibacteraceae bacterium]